MTPRWMLEPMRRRHLRGVMAIERVSFSSPWPMEAFTCDMDGPLWARALALLDAGRPDAGVRGYICFWTLEGELTIQNIAVHPDVRRLGGAWHLMEAAFEEGHRRACRWAYLEVRPTNSAAIDLYRRWGFDVAARRRGYYTDTGEDALVMRADVERGLLESGRPSTERSLKGSGNG